MESSRQVTMTNLRDCTFSGVAYPMQILQEYFPLQTYKHIFLCMVLGVLATLLAFFLGSFSQQKVVSARLTPPIYGTQVFLDDWLILYIIMCAHRPTTCQTTTWHFHWPRTCHSWSQCWYCCGYLYRHLHGVLLCWSPAGYTHHLLLPRERKREEQWTATPLHLRGPPAYSSVWWGGSRQAGVERECFIWSSGHTGDEKKSFIWSCGTLVGLDCWIDSCMNIDIFISKHRFYFALDNHTYCSLQFLIQ